MCGIAGFAGTELPEAHVADAFASSLRHRGPDGMGSWRDNHALLLHARLAVIDLGPQSDQPFVSLGGDFVLVFNGEIYNYLELRNELSSRGCTFLTKSDTEVLVESYRVWGSRCIEHFNGMFAFALYDVRKKRVLLGRDRAGEKPLYYSHRPNRLAFASELRTLLNDKSVSQGIDGDALRQYLKFGYVPSPRTIVAGVFKIPPASAAEFDVEKGTMRLWQYWRLPDADGIAIPTGSLLSELEACLTEAVKAQLVADVPLGILLSGGIDSGLIAAVAARISSRKPRTFTVSFQGIASLDESKAARRVAQHIGADHEEIVVDGASVDMAGILDAAMDEPIADPSIIPTFILAKNVRKHCTVALGGDGGDELFGGYSHYRRPSWTPPNSIVRSIANRSDHLPAGFPGRGRLLGYGLARKDQLNPAALFDNRLVNWILPSQGKADPRCTTHLKGSPLQVSMADDFQTYLPDDVLTKVDRASMASALEVRAPWLDYRLIEFAFRSVPDSLRVSGSVTKILPRKLAMQLLPTNSHSLPKRGFGPPIDNWISHSWRDACLSELSASKTLFRPKQAEWLVNSTRRGYRNGSRAFALVAFERWRRSCGLSDRIVYSSQIG